jgi:L-2-hydroxyglutarate oxidase LhgO
LVVATEESEIPALEAIITTAAANGVDDLEMMGPNQAIALEPELSCVAAVLSPSTGIIDSHSLMVSYQGDLENAGGMCAFNTAVMAVSPRDGGGFDVIARDESGEEITITTRRFINAGGLGAQAIAHHIAGYPADLIPKQYLSRGCYFTMDGKAPFQRLIYPAPRPESLGCHFSADMSGRSRFGPDHEWIDTLAYDVNPSRAESFYGAVRRYFPALPDNALHTDYAGVRPKIQAPGEPPADFRIDGPDRHSVPGLVNLFGIESPGLTSSLAIGQLVAERLNLVETQF